MTKLSEKEIFKQNSLTIDRLNNFLTPKLVFKPSRKRPEGSLIELINWTTEQFCTEPQSHGSYIHNKIVMDGAFMQFCEETGINIECLLKDSIASWQSDDESEQFIAQGVFKVTRGNVEFLQCSLFHKGNQNEDEVSFFILVKNSLFESYISLRNEYEDWRKEREKASQEIYVVGGEPVSYDLEVVWDDLIIPKDLRTEIQTSVEGFLKAESFYKENSIPWKRGLFFYGEPGCGKSHCIKILLSEYGFKPVTINGMHPNKDQLLEEAFEYAENHGPSLLFLEDLPEMINSIDLSFFLQLMDGVSSREGLLVIATANDLSNIPKSLTDRPSRFDRKIHFPLPSREMALKFLKSKFKTKLKAKEYDVILNKVIKNKFSFAHLKELYVASAHIAISENRKAQNYNDVEMALSLLLKDKGNIQRGFGLISKTIDIERFIKED